MNAAIDYDIISKAGAGSNIKNLTFKEKKMLEKS